MNHPSRIVTWRWTPGESPSTFDDRAKSLDEVSSRLPEGAYSTFRTFGGNRVLCFEDHVIRLEESARLTGRAVVVDAAGLRGVLRNLLPRAGMEDVRVRLTLDLAGTPGMMFISLEPLLPPPDWKYSQGVRAVTCALRRPNPKAKSTGFIPQAEIARQAIPEGVEEGLMVERGTVLEGLSSNFFAVDEGDVVTAPGEVLEGITRRLVLEEIAGADLPLRREAPALNRLANWTEAWITSSSRGVMPVVQIDNQMIGAGVPGPVSRRIAAAYDRRVQREAQPL